MPDIIVSASVLIAAASRIDPDLVRFFPVPPASGSDTVDVLGVFAYPGDANFSLILSDEILESTLTVLGDPRGLAWEFDQRDAFATELEALATRTHGGFVQPAPVAVPPGVDELAAQALRCAASPDLGSGSVAAAICDDPAALRCNPWKPHGRDGPEIGVLSPAQFRGQAVRARLHLRPPDKP